MALLGRALAGLLGATMDQLWEFPLLYAVGGFAMRRERAEPIDWFDIVLVLVVAGCGYLGVRRALRGGERAMTLRYQQTRLRVPQISLWHFLYDAAWLALGITFAYAAMFGPGRADGRGRDLGLGVGIAATATVLAVLRGVLLLRHKRASRMRARA